MSIYYFVHSRSYRCGIIARLVSLDPPQGDLGFSWFLATSTSIFLWLSFPFFPFWLWGRALPFYCFCSISTFIFGSHFLGGWELAFPSIFVHCFSSVGWVWIFSYFLGWGFGVSHHYTGHFFIWCLNSFIFGFLGFVCPKTKWVLILEFFQFWGFYLILRTVLFSQVFLA